MNHDDECISSIDGNVAMPMNDVSTYPISFGSEEEFLLSNEKYLGETEDFSLPVEASLILDLNGGWERLNRHRSNSDAISCLWMSDRECVSDQYRIHRGDGDCLIPTVCAATFTVLIIRDSDFLVNI